MYAVRHTVYTLQIVDTEVSVVLLRKKRRKKKKDIEDILVGPAVAKNVSGFYMTDSMLWFRAYTKPKWSPHLSEFVNFKLIQISSCQSVHSFQLSS